MPLLTSYTAAEVADICGVSVHQVQRWGKRGLLSPRLPRHEATVCSIYRGYTDTHIREVRRIVRILENNRTLVDIRDMLHPELESEAV